MNSWNRGYPFIRYVTSFMIKILSLLFHDEYSFTHNINFGLGVYCGFEDQSTPLFALWIPESTF